ncbi:MAG TPA: hypothetical protein VIW25_08745, partial [Nitrososphaeraceae archaeon]
LYCSDPCEHQILPHLSVVVVVVEDSYLRHHIIIRYNNKPLNISIQLKNNYYQISNRIKGWLQLAKEKNFLYVIN